MVTMTIGTPRTAVRARHTGASRLSLATSAVMLTMPRVVVDETRTWIGLAMTSTISMDDEVGLI